MNMKQVRPRLDKWELATMHRLLDKEYRQRKAKLKRQESGIAYDGQSYEDLHRLGSLRRRLGKLLRLLKGER